MPKLVNRGPLINFITGITGVAPGGVAVVNLPTNMRYHQLTFQCTAVNYTGGTAKAITKIVSSAGAGATGTLTIVNGVPTAIAIVAGGSGWTVGDTFTIADDTGTGFVGTVATVTGGPPGALTTATVTVAGTPSAVNPATMITSFKLLVNGINMRDINPAYTTMIAQANGFNSKLGELSIYFTEPWRNIVSQNEVASWDMFGQSTFQAQITIASNVTNPGLTGIQKFDYSRNVRPVQQGNQTVAMPFLQPVSQHQFSWPIVSGRNDINQLPFSYPISRVWLQGSVASQITQVEVYQDSNKILETTTQQLQQAYEDFGFQFGQGNYLNQNSTTTAVRGVYNPITYFDAAFISDPDQRIYKALSCQNSYILRVYSSQAMTLNIVQEMLPGAYQA